MEFSQKDLVILRNALTAYQQHLEPSSHVREVAEWSNKIADVQSKLDHILLRSGPEAVQSSRMCVSSYASCDS